jgi:Na+-driven multidrug efflux pump
VFTNAIQAMGAALPSLILSISRQGLIYIPVVLLFSKIFDSAKMIVAAQPCTDYIALILSAVLYSITYKKYFIDSPKDISLALQ